MAKPGTGQGAPDGAYYRGTAGSFILAATLPRWPVPGLPEPHVRLVGWGML